MAQYIKQGNIFGRIGTGIGKGLAEQFPEEMNRGRLAAGLQKFESEHQDLNPMQQLARLSAIPGITPQMLQSFTELARYNNQANAYKKSVPNRQSNENRSSPNLNEIKQANLLDQAANAGMPVQQPLNPQTNQMESRGLNEKAGLETNNQRTPNLKRESDIPQVAEGNPLNAQNLPRLPWTPQQRNEAIADYIDQGFLPEQAKQLASDDEARSLGEPEVFKQRQSEIKSAKTEARNALQRHLELKLQKSKEGLFEDVEGVMLNNAERGMIRDLIVNPRADIDNVANDWSERLYRTALAKKKLKTLGATTGIENFLKGNQTKQQLQEYQDIFKKSGNLEEYQNLLQSELKLSGIAAASVAYPINKKFNKYIESYKPNYNPSNADQRARKAAIDIEKLNLDSDDSILSIMRALKEKDPYFDQQAFIEQISEDKDTIGLNNRQRLELVEPRNIIPNWADLLYLPFIRR